MTHIVLASASPRRKAILKSLHLEFETFISSFDEKSVQIKEAEPLCTETARQKAKTAAMAFTKQNPGKKDVLIIAADTLVFKNSAVFGKPASRDEARQMLLSHSGKTHNVITAMCALHLADCKCYEEKNISRVFFKQLTHEEIEGYLQTEEWKDAAGGYKIQGKASLFIEKIEGSYSGIVGLPIHSLYAILKKADIGVL